MMYQRHIGPGTGLRLDEGGPNDFAAGSVGQCIDLARKDKGYTLFVRESEPHSAAGRVLLTLSIEVVWALREGCNHLLVEAGHERFVTVAVPS